MVSVGQVMSLRLPDVDVIPEGQYHFAGVYCFGKGVFAGKKKLGLEFAYRRLTRLCTNNFVYPKLMAWEGALAIVPPECNGLYVSPEFPVFEIDQRQAEPRYLDHYFRRPSIWPELSGGSTGTNVRRKRLHPSTFLSHCLPLPPLVEQRRLVERIDALAARIEEARRLRAEADEESDALAHSHLDEAYRAQVALRGTVQLADVCSTITDGAHLTPAFQDQGVKFVFVGNVSSGRLHFTGCRYVSPDYYRTVAPTRRPRRGDVLYSAVGATLGIPALVD
jgi:hypothetical protein